MSNALQVSHSYALHMRHALQMRHHLEMTHALQDRVYEGLARDERGRRRIISGCSRATTTTTTCGSHRLVHAPPLEAFAVCWNKALTLVTARLRVARFLHKFRLQQNIYTNTLHTIHIPTDKIVYTHIHAYIRTFIDTYTMYIHTYTRRPVASLPGGGVVGGPKGDRVGRGGVCVWGGGRVLL